MRSFHAPAQSCDAILFVYRNGRPSNRTIGDKEECQPRTQSNNCCMTLLRCINNVLTPRKSSRIQKRTSCSRQPFPETISLFFLPFLYFCCHTVITIWWSSLFLFSLYRARTLRAMNTLVNPKCPFSLSNGPFLRRRTQQKTWCCRVWCVVFCGSTVLPGGLVRLKRKKLKLKVIQTY